MDISSLGSKKSSVVPTPFRGLRILLIDEDTNSLMSVASILEQQSYKVTSVELQSEAFSILQGHAERIDLVVADVNMEETNCLKFMESIQLIKELPIILMSSTAKKEMVKEAMLKGACFFLKKPISKEQLKNVWQHVYRKRRRQIMDANGKNKDDEDHENGSRGYKAEEVDSIPRHPRIICENGSEEQTKRKETDSDERKNQKISKHSGKRSVGAEHDVPEGSKRRRIGDDEYCESEESSPREFRDITGDKKERRDNSKDNASPEKKSRLCWTSDLQQKFKEAISILGADARPKRVLEIMKVPHLTQRQVASHLQKFRVRALRIEHSGATPSLIQSRISTSNARNRSIQIPKRHSPVQFSQEPQTSSSHLGVDREKFVPLSVSLPGRKIGNLAANFGMLHNQSNHSKNSGANVPRRYNNINGAPYYGGVLESSSQELCPRHTSSDSKDVEAPINGALQTNYNNRDETQDVYSRDLHKLNWSREDGNLLMNVTQNSTFSMNSGYNHELVTVPSELQQRLNLTPDFDDYYACQNTNQFDMAFTELLQKTDIGKGLFPFEGSSNPNKLTTEFGSIIHELPEFASSSYDINQRQ